MHEKKMDDFRYSSNYFSLKKIDKSQIILFNTQLLQKQSVFILHSTTQHSRIQQKIRILPPCC